MTDKPDPSDDRAIREIMQGQSKTIVVPQPDVVIERKPAAPTLTERTGK